MWLWNWHNHCARHCWRYQGLPVATTGCWARVREGRESDQRAKLRTSPLPYYFWTPGNQPVGIEWEGICICESCDSLRLILLSVTYFGPKSRPCPSSCRNAYECLRRFDCERHWLPACCGSTVADTNHWRAGDGEGTRTRSDWSRYRGSCGGRTLQVCCESRT